MTSMNNEFLWFVTQREKLRDFDDVMSDECIAEGCTLMSFPPSRLGRAGGSWLSRHIVWVEVGARVFAKDCRSPLHDTIQGIHNEKLC